MKFDEFKNNVERLHVIWGLPEGSTEKEQIKYGVHEFKEYTSAGNNYDKSMELCDIIVFSINAAKYQNKLENFKPEPRAEYLDRIYNYFTGGFYALAINGLIERISYHSTASNWVEFIFEETWKKISKRKGKIIDGKFTKYESMTKEQQKEYDKNDIGNTLIREKLRE